MNLLIQILTTLSLVIGILLGEIASSKVFGNFKKTWHHLIEIAFFVTIIVLIFNTIAIKEYSNEIIISIYFLTGFVTIIFARGILTGLGVFSKKIQKKVLNKKDEKDYIIGLKKALERRKFKKEKIKKIAKEVGFSKKDIKQVFQFFEKEKK